MQHLAIAPDGPEFSRLVYGTWRMLSDQPTPQDINRRLNACVELGITTIDTAEIYGLYEVEESLGAAMALSPGLREKLQIVTKAGIYVPCKHHPERRTAHYNAGGERMVKSLEKSLRLLGTDHVELLLVHRPDWLTRADDTAAGLNQLLREGKIRAAGVSNFSAAQFDLLNSRMERPLATNQIEFHLLRMEPIYDGTLAQCEKAGILPMAWSPLAGGRLFDPKSEAAERIARAVHEMAPRVWRGDCRAIGLRLDFGPSQPAAADPGHEPHRADSLCGCGGRYRAGTRGLVRPLAGGPGEESAVKRRVGGARNHANGALREPVSAESERICGVIFVRNPPSPPWLATCTLHHSAVPGSARGLLRPTEVVESGNSTGFHRDILRSKRDNVCITRRESQHHEKRYCQEG